jgi:HEAT repeat protein
LALLFVLLSSGCGSGDGDERTPPQTARPVEAVTPPSPPQREPIPTPPPLDSAEQGREAAEVAKGVSETGNEDWQLWVDEADEVDIENEGEREQLVDLMKHGPSPEVRIAAMNRLTDWDSPQVLDHLLTALDDSDTEVVFEALDEIEFVGDESTVPKLSGCLSHPEPDIVERCQEAIEFLE